MGGISDYFADIYTNTKSAIVGLPANAGTIFQFRQVPGFPISWLELILIIVSCVVLALAIVGGPASPSADAATTIAGGFRRCRRSR